ncbi:MAG: malto-oligosyltrehalose trehalohydrolase [Deltaproteobacteria bacterium]|nr:malto-oligosyltrehalose trehalohydrolase [Deltaproteobacteria bacterium]
MRIGARYLGNGRCEFVVWAPGAGRVELKLSSPPHRILAMERYAKGYWRTIADDVPPGSRYLFRLDNGKELPDPASLFQPEGVHAPSQVVDHDAFSWEDAGWRGMIPTETVIYELHVGTFTPQGTFDAVIPRLRRLKELGITALELMPVAQFPGERNWGYDGVYPFSVHHAYGGPDGLKRLVNACHWEGLAVILDVVYNHLGPEGNYLGEFGQYCTDRYRTPWGEALNFDGAGSNEVRNYFVENALYWFRDYHMDGLRLDAIQWIENRGARPFLQELSRRVEEFSFRTGKKRFLMAESDLNDAGVIAPPGLGGLGLDALWCDDFHHALHALLTGERDGYYRDFGRVGQLAKSLREGFVYSGQYSHYRERNHGASSKGIAAERFVVFAQNHDQTGNRMHGERLSRLVSFEAQKLAAGVLLLSPYLPLLFMGEEYGEDAPFLYFVDHSDARLVEAVRNGRREEFKAFGAGGKPPDPALEETFLTSKIDWEKRDRGNHRILLALYRRLLQWRRELSCLRRRDNEQLDAFGHEGDGLLFLHRWSDEERILCVFNFSREQRDLKTLPVAGEWLRLIDSADAPWNGPGTLLPERIPGRGKLAVRGESFALFHGKEDGR